MDEIIEELERQAIEETNSTTLLSTQDGIPSQSISEAVDDVVAGNPSPASISQVGDFMATVIRGA